MQKKTTKPPRFNTTSAARCILDGGVLAYPTEGVYGIGCNPADEQALNRLLAIKSRDSDKGLILIAANTAQLSPWMATLSGEQLRRIGTSWPGPVTWIVPARERTSGLLTGGRSTLAARVTAHQPVIDLCLAADTALVSTSANLSGHPPARTPEALSELAGIDGFLQGPLGTLSTPTPIYDVVSGSQLRA